MDGPAPCQHEPGQSGAEQGPALPGRTDLTGHWSLRDRYLDGPWTTPLPALVPQSGLD